MAILRGEGALWLAQHEPILSGSLDASGSRPVMAAKEPAAAG